MRVLVACHGLWPQTPVGGMETQTYDLCRHLCEKRIDVTCAVPSPQIQGDEPFPTRGFSWPKLKPWLFANHLFSRSVVKHIQSETYDVALSLGFALATWKPHLRTKLVFFTAGLNALQEPSFDPRSIWMRRMISRLTRLATKTIVETPFMGGVLQKNVRIDPDRLVTIFPGISLPADDYKPSSRTRGKILFVGRFSEEKGVRDIPKLVELLGPGQCKAVAIGQGSLKNVLEKMTGDSIQILAPMGRTELQDHFNDAEILILPSRSEGLPRAAMEALSCGLPVVASQVGGLNDLIDDRTVYGFPPKDVGAMAEIVSRLLKRDEETLEADERLAILRAREAFALNRYLSDYESLFRELTPQSRNS